MNILQIVASPGWGGGEKYLYELSESLIERGHKVRIVGPADIFSRERFREIAPYDEMNMKSFLNVFKLTRFLKTHQIEIIHTHIFRHAIIACLAAKLSKQHVKVVMTRHLVKKAKTSMLYRWLYRNIDHIVFVSRAAQQEFLKSAKQVEAPVNSVVYNAIRQIPESPTEISTNPETAVIGYTGRLTPEKGVDTLIQAFALIKNKKTQLTILGTGNQKYIAQLKTITENSKVNDRVIFTGFIDNVYQHIQTFDIAVVPSRWREPFGLVLLEYMSQGIPVISTNNGAQPEIITNGTDGILIDPNNPQLLAEQIDILLEDANLRQQISIAAKKRSLDFSFDKFIDQIETIYQN